MTEEEEDALKGNDDKENGAPHDYVPPPRENIEMVGILQPNPKYACDPLSHPALEKVSYYPVLEKIRHYLNT